MIIREGVSDIAVYLDIYYSPISFLMMSSTAYT
jgi:hypothetical protein